MRKFNKNKKNVIPPVPEKLCPFFQENCKGNQCMLYHEQFGRCTIELLSFNTYALKEAIDNSLQEQE